MNKIIQAIFGKFMHKHDNMFVTLSRSSADMEQADSNRLCDGF